MRHLDPSTDHDMNEAAKDRHEAKRRRFISFKDFLQQPLELEYGYKTPIYLDATIKATVVQNGTDAMEINDIDIGNVYISIYPTGDDTFMLDQSHLEGHHSNIYKTFVATIEKKILRAAELAMDHEWDEEDTDDF